MFRMKKSVGLTVPRMMQKINNGERKKGMLNDVIRKLDKTDSTVRTSAASGLPCSSRTHENTKVVFFA